MYLPERFQVSDPQLTLNLLQDFPLATMISINSEGPVISHIPIVTEVTPEGLVLWGHLSQRNGHWKYLDLKTVTFVFHGPQAYISPQWYEKNDVPTWNYAVVHIKGDCELIEDREGILTCLKKLSQFAESKFQNQWQFWLPEDLAAEGVIEKSILGFKVKVTSIQSKFKMNQSRSESDLRGTIAGLRSENNSQAEAVAQLMQTVWSSYNKKVKQ